MSMMGHFRYLSRAALALLQRKPELTEALASYAPQSEEHGLPAGVPPQVQSMLAKVPPGKREAVLKRLMASLEQKGMLVLLQNRQDQSAKTLKAAGLSVEGIGPTLDIRQAWNGLHFLLAGTSDEPTAPPGDAILGGRELGDDVGYGPMRVMTSAQVAATASALAALDPASLRASYDPSKMENLNIYPGHWDEPERRQWLIDTFAEVRDYSAAAARKKAGMAFWLS